MDARKQNDIKFVITAHVVVDDGISFPKNENVSVFEKTTYPSDILKTTPKKEKMNPLIVGFGPAGMFSALLLARCGFNPIVVEQGECVEERAKTVSFFLKTGVLNPSSNVQFGEGGAGTFSDGKLITRVNDKRINFILKTFVEMGAPESILTEAKPHIGTDILQKVVKNIREEIISLGGSVLFNTKMTSLSQRIGGVEVELNGKDKIFSPAVILAIGHSSHDTYKMLLDKGFDIKGKDFSVGVRIEHLREDVEFSLYGKASLQHEFPLPSAEYSVSHREGDRGVYSFCMCPGGLVMASNSEEESIVTNGMSYNSRSERNSNSALAVSVHASDYQNTPLGAIEYQRKLEKLAWQVAGDNRAPCQSVGDFLDSRVTTSFGKITPSYPHSVIWANLDDILPQNLSAILKNGLRFFARKHSFFAERSAPLTAIETRTSSPVRIEREKDLTAKGFDKIYPSGEGAGWAGGITSASIDGLKVAESYILGEEYDKSWNSN